MRRREASFFISIIVAFFLGTSGTDCLALDTFFSAALSLSTPPPSLSPSLSVGSENGNEPPSKKSSPRRQDGRADADGGSRFVFARSIAKRPKSSFVLPPSLIPTDPQIDGRGRTRTGTTWMRRRRIPMFSPLLNYWGWGGCAYSFPECAEPLSFSRVRKDKDGERARKRRTPRANPRSASTSFSGIRCHYTA